MDTPTVPELVAARVASTPGKPFLFSELDGRSWTYAEFSREVGRTAAMLASHGVGRGDVVSLLLPNSAEYVVAYFACWHIGALAGPINSLLKREEIEWTVSHSGSKLLLAGSEFADRIPGDNATSDPGNASAPACTSADAARTVVPHLPNSLDPSCVYFDDVSALPDGSVEPARLTSHDEAIIIYTSGTTGKPKGCLLTHSNLIANARQITDWMGFGPDDRLLTVMPLFHMNAVTVTTMTALYCGGSTVVSPKFSASRFWDVIEMYQVTSFGSVATMLSMLLAGGAASGNERGDRARESDLTSARPPATLPYDRVSARSLRFAMCGSAPVPAEVLKRFEETFGILVIEGYGLSESTCRATFNPPNETRRPGSCGLPIGNEMRVVDDDDNDVPTGELGEIVLRGPNIFKGYFKDPAATERAFRGGWFHTGDIAYRDAQGYFHIADRKSDMIIRGGENIYPREIDELLYTHPAVAAAAAIGAPDELYGEEVTAFVVLKEGRSVSEAEIIDYCRARLADFKCPKTVHFVADIPKGPTGKLLKRELAKLLLPRKAS